MLENISGLSQSQNVGRLLVTLAEAAQRLAISKRTLEREIAAGRFARPVKIGRASRVPVSELDAYIRRLTGQPS